MPLDPSRPFLRQDGLRAGLTKHALDGPAFHAVFGSVRLAADVSLTPEVLGRCASLVVPRCAVSQHTAAEVWGGAVPPTAWTHVSVARAEDRRARLGLRCHVNPSAIVRTRAGLRLTTPAQTVLDLSRELALVDVTVLADSLLHRRVLTPGELEQRFDDYQGGLPRIAAVARTLVRPGAESPMETRARLLLVLAGLPEPVLQHEVGDTRHRFRLDLAYPELRVAVEYDGRHHAQDARQWGHDLARREWLDGRGWRLVVLRAGDVYGTPWATALRVAGVLAERGVVRNLPAHPPASFASYFPEQPWRAARS
ncbi:MAG: hypothetical protein DI571_08230 [Arsenicicoccus sp.]|nr:MAG: hypothetical protein DI571_08230 [Arsenicicoccus sp.]